MAAAASFDGGAGGGAVGLNPDLVNSFFNALELVSSTAADGTGGGASDLALLEEAERRCLLDVKTQELLRLSRARTDDVGPEPKDTLPSWVLLFLGTTPLDGDSEDAIRRGVDLAIPRLLQPSAEQREVELAVTRVGLEVRGGPVPLPRVVFALATGSVLSIVHATEEFDAADAAALVETMCFQCRDDAQAAEVATRLEELSRGPAAGAVKVTDEVVQLHGRGPLGFKIATMHARKGYEHGVFVVDVTPGSSAALARLAIGAQVVGVGDRDAEYATADDVIGWVRREQVETGHVRLRVRHDMACLRVRDANPTPVVRFRGEAD